MSNVDLTANIGGFLTLRHPFWIASAHYSEKNSAIDAWSEYKPAAITLKTCHLAPRDEETETTRFPTYPSLARFGRSFYCDGPKQKELLTYERAADLLRYAQEKLPDTLVGVSVICDQDQDYERLRAMCKNPAFCELNLKYSFRFKKQGDASFFENAAQSFKILIDQIGRFTKAFADIPVFVKVPRELSWLPETRELNALLGLMVMHGKAGFIVANSLKLAIPPFVKNGREYSFRNGVLCGESLFDQTISLIEQFREPCEKNRVPIIATGGMIEPEQVLTALRVGASAVQLCTAFDYYHPNYYSTLCWNLQNRIELRGLDSFSKYVAGLRRESVASIYNMPFMYFERFWSEDIQRRIMADIRSSSSMSVFVMSGKSVGEEWENAFKQRFQRNLGLRLLLPKPEGPTFVAIQKAWGISEDELGARQTRVRDAMKHFNKMWEDTRDKRKEGMKEDDKEAEFEARNSDQCPFYSFYLFDDKVYVAPYPFIRPGKLESPVYIFFAGSPEFERIQKEADLLFDYARQTNTTA